MSPAVENTLKAYRALDPQGWVAAHALLPPWAGWTLAGFGLFFLLFGGRRFFRLVAGPISFALGFLFAPMLAAKLSLPQTEQVALFCGAGLAVLGFAVPPAAVFFAVGLPAGFAAGEIVGSEDWLLGFSPAFFVCGLVAALLHRVIAAVVSSVAGGWLLMIGLLAGLTPHVPIRQVTSQPYGVIVAALFFAVAGTVFQLKVRPSPEQADQIKMDRAKLKRRKQEQKEMEARWGKYKADE